MNAARVFILLAILGSFAGCEVPAKNVGAPVTAKPTSNPMTYDIRIEHASARPLAVVHRRATQPELSKVVPEACGLVWNAIKESQVEGGRLVAVYFDDVINLEVGAEVSGAFPGRGEVVGSTLPGGTVATAVHMGPYQKLGETHTAIRRWCAEHHRTLAGPNWEIYAHWRDEWNNDPSKIRTDVYYLLKSE